MPGNWSRRARARRSLAIRAIPTPSACCAACRAMVGARITAGSRRYRASCRRRVRSAAVGCSSSAAATRPIAAGMRHRRWSTWMAALAVASIPSAPQACRTTPGLRPRAPRARARAAMPLMRTRNLSKTYEVAGKSLQAVHEVTLELWPGETLGLVGESASGKSSLAKLLPGLSAPDSGITVELAGEPLSALAGDRTLAQRKALQIVFQNPGLALYGSQTVRRLIHRSLS